MGRTIRETSLYEAGVALFAVLLGLALLHPFELFAADVVAKPLDGDWILRLLFVGLAVRVILYFHAVIGEMKLSTLVDSPPRAKTTGWGSLPGTSSLSGTYGAMLRFWLGAVAIGLFFIAGAAIERGVATFLVWFAAYVMLDLFWELSYLAPRRRRALEELARARYRPWVLLRVLVGERRVAVSELDLEAERGVTSDENVREAVELSWVRAVLWWAWLDLAALTLYAGLIALDLTTPGLAPAAAAVWLAFELSIAGLEYFLFPQLFAA